MVSDELIIAALEGDQTAIKRVFTWLYPELRSVLGKVPESERDDVLHDALAAMLRKMSADAPRGAARFRGWAISYVRMQGRSARRQRSRTLSNRSKAAGALGPLAAETSVWTRVQRLRDFRAVAKLVDALSTRYQRLLRHQLEDESDKSLAERFGLAPGTIRSQRSRAYKRLRLALGLDTSPSPAG